ncbi:WecB/TagA/CpsF family glycosyltransferase [Aporhodopirellula aestuarii]|uniref:WecB/TagA/CpsF family glycosyltransferase n=1 Tax=Aporhodopirellula aestuarii TaxID=2950107 RepID=A0ABT0UDL5_9BACT|nr:WecB/TagA/CpsF family glycosyltransferase [Aporhodopirellula aestuarii]MCM2375147.1 WecB/TagA/CpsF family glycosyltransferase [Aporhodopirellula aestuarii]
MIASAAQRQAAIVSCHAVHAITTISGEECLRKQANDFAMITPDGQPVRWALNLLYKAKLKERVYGPELMQRVIKSAVENDLPIYLYGGTPDSLQQLETNLLANHPGLKIAGSESPPFRPLSEQEMIETAERINSSESRIVFIGLGCPKQDKFAAAQAHRIQAVQVCVGAAFDFHAGIKPMAPEWMQRYGLEWLFRLKCEPHRLWKRYLVTNSVFCMRLLVAYFSSRQDIAKNNS